MIGVNPSVNLLSALSVFAVNPQRCVTVALVAPLRFNIREMPKKRITKKQLLQIEQAAVREERKEQGALDGRFREKVEKSKKTYTRKTKHKKKAIVIKKKTKIVKKVVKVKKLKTLS